MANSFEIEINSQNSFYKKYQGSSGCDRKVKVYFSVPERGTDSDTGLLLFIAGFGGQATSKVYKKMRESFADEYNLVTIQCDYFGYEFMQEPKNIYVFKSWPEKLRGILTDKEIEEISEDGGFNLEKFYEIASKYEITFEIFTDLSEENTDNFNDMGLLQAVDNITAVLNVMNILFENSCEFNTKKIIMYGHSHGAYLSHLCNAFAPTLFSLIIDNSAWLYPVYLRHDRLWLKQANKLTIQCRYNYLAKKVIRDLEILDLEYLYTKFHNNCSIITYQGTEDNLINHKQKQSLCSKIKKCSYNEVDESKVDDIIFKSTKHGLDADFLKLFEYAMKEYNNSFEKDNLFQLDEEVVLETSKYIYIIDYSNIAPHIKIWRK